MALTVKQENFAQAYVETGNASEAYRRAYDVGENTKPEVIHVKACELLKTGNVSVRVVELQADARERHDVTVDSLTEEYEEARGVAKDEKQAAAMVSATTGKAKLHGLDINKNEHSGPDGGPMILWGNKPE
jgi:phage terminase small subunit